MRDQLLPLLEEIPDDGPDLLLEPMAGQGQMLCATVQDLGPYLEALDWHPKAGVCLDTCHAFSAGHDLSTPEGVKETFDALHEIAPGRLKLIHANDSKDAAGLEEGPPREHRRRPHRRAGASPRSCAIRRSAGVPLCIETPGKADKHREDIDLLKKLRG